MLLRLFLACALCLLGSRAEALDWIIFDLDDQPVECRQGGDAPVPGKDCPDGYTVKAWIVYNDENGKPDTDYRHYIPVLTGVRRVVKNDPGVITPSPNIDGFFADLAASDAFSDEEVLSALRCKFILDKDTRDEAILRYASGLSPEKLQALLAIAQKNYIQLPIQP